MVYTKDEMKQAARTHIARFIEANDTFATACAQKWKVGYPKEILSVYDKWTNFADTVGKLGSISDFLPKSCIMQYQTSRRSPYMINPATRCESVILAFYLPRDVDFELSFRPPFKFFQQPIVLTRRADATELTLAELIEIEKRVPFTLSEVECDPAFVRVQWVYPFLRRDMQDIRLSPTNTDENVTIYAHQTSIDFDDRKSFFNDPWVAAWAHWGSDGLRWLTEASYPLTFVVDDDSIKSDEHSRLSVLFPQRKDIEEYDSNSKIFDFNEAVVRVHANPFLVT